MVFTVTVNEAGALVPNALGAVSSKRKLSEPASAAGEIGKVMTPVAGSMLAIAGKLLAPSKVPDGTATAVVVKVVPAPPKAS